MLCFDFQRRGSFLSRDKDTLAKIANMSKSKSAVNPSGARSSGKFVFQVISPDKDSQVVLIGVNNIH